MQERKDKKKKNLFNTPFKPAGCKTNGWLILGKSSSEAHKQ
jgi:hypothetical protein